LKLFENKFSKLKKNQLKIKILILNCSTLAISHSKVYKFTLLLNYHDYFSFPLISFSDLFLIHTQMIGICLLALLSCTMAAITQSPPTTQSQIAQAAAVTINPKLRRALLEALSSFDGDDSTESDEETTTSSNLGDLEDVTNNPSFIKVHSFAIDGDKSDENEIIKTIIISRPRTTLTPPKPTLSDDVEINFEKTPDPINSVGINSQNIQQARSVETRLTLNGEKKEEKQAKKKASEKSVTKPIAPTTTTTTLPPPVTNADGENIEKVEKNDVKIFQAPLLAAFTVQQDVNGQPNKVISLFKNPQHKKQPEVTTSRIINMEFRPSQPEVSTSAPIQTPVTTVQAQTQNAQLISVFEQRQRQLEEQIRILQAKQREQEEIIRGHRIEQQNRLRIEQQQVQLRFQQPPAQQVQPPIQQVQQPIQQQQVIQQQIAQPIQQQQIQQVQQPIQQQQVIQPVAQTLVAPPSPNVNVQFIPSIPLGHTVGISVEQQLPFKGPAEFNPDKPNFQKSFHQRQQQFQFQQFQQQQAVNQGFANQQQVSQLPNNLELPVRQPQEFRTFTNLPTHLELPQRQFQTFNSAPLSVLPSLTEVVPQTQSRNRVFRNDALQTGNFGVNIQRQQLVPVEQNFDSQLQNLLIQSGISPRSTEDFRIISKVLSLNHGIPNELLFNNNNPGRFF
jgi:hypothetical protein